MRKLIHTRLSKNEKETVEKLAKKFGMTMSDYIKCKLFDQNPDLTDEDIKYLHPQSSKQAYFLAFSVMKLQRMLRAILLGQRDLTLDEFSELDTEVANTTRKIIAAQGYKKIKKDQDG